MKYFPSSIDLRQSDECHRGNQFLEFRGRNSNWASRRYVHGPGEDEPLVWYEGSGTSDRRWLHADERGGVVAVTNASCTAIAINAYDEYGIPGPSNLGRFQYSENAAMPGASSACAAQTWIPELGGYHQVFLAQL